MKESPIDIIKNDHRKVEDLFEKFENAETAKRRGTIGTMILDELDRHTLMEEEIFYPAMKAENEGQASAMVDESYVEHAQAKQIIARLRDIDPASDEFADGMIELKQIVENHVEEEETRLLPYAEEKLQGDEMAD
jgi:hemerythrin-like domain-containing protein